MITLKALSFGTRNINAQVYSNFYNLFQVSEYFCHFLSFSALGVKQSPQRFDNRLLNIFQL